MALPIVRLGDPTSHGGSVISASATHLIGNIGIARVGDQVACPLPGHGINIIIEGTPTYLIGGRMVALHGHHCACGCTLISSLVTATYG
ncbi:putative Zn-binding protein involved in type VI secretion [Duganella sp. SG902]|uniref:PAAR domain-containing protein n=1 Tax=Duganella sp. SG902 TaxID=2587016 RepID=UPI00159E09A1|nr:PAAR domain-containing protein [Duganella sp. SG902]NVM75485.1 putative Zn-binding protein involved in type VI secretion [Duganella sp. SG902]